MVREAIVTLAVAQRAITNERTRGIVKYHPMDLVFLTACHKECEYAAPSIGETLVQSEDESNARWGRVLALGGFQRRRLSLNHYVLLERQPGSTRQMAFQLISSSIMREQTCHASIYSGAECASQRHSK